MKDNIIQQCFIGDIKKELCGSTTPIFYPKKNIVHFWESQRLDAEDALMVEAGISGDSRTV